MTPPDSQFPHDHTMTYDPARSRIQGVSDSDFSPPTFMLGRPRDPAERAPTEPTGPAFTFHEMVGRGGMGEVWRATQHSLGRYVAVKRARSVMDDAEARRVFLQEAHITARLEHPNIVPIHELGHDECGIPMMAMKLVYGDPWSRRISEDFHAMAAEGFLARHLPILVSVCHAVEYAHACGIIHRDLKPSQVMLGSFGEVLLMDWGLAIHISELIDPRAPEQPREFGAHFPTPASASNPAGTPGMMAPEQTETTAARVGPATDTYLLAGCLYNLLTGTFPHHASDARGAFNLAASGRVTTPSERAPGRAIPRGLEELCMHGLKAEPKDRPASVAEFRRGLEDYLAGTSRRRESLQLAREAATAIKAGVTDDAGFQSVFALLDRALLLWGENDEALPLRDAAHLRYAREALGRGDLVLARVQAGFLPAGPEREDLLESVRRAEHSAAMRERQRRWLMVSTVALLGIIAVGATQFSLQLAEEKSEAVAARGRAESAEGRATLARTGAEDLVEFMLVDFRDNVRTLGKLDMLDSVAAKVMDYYDRVGAQPGDEGAARRRARALIQVSRIREMQGRLPEALEAAEAAVGTFSSMGEGTPEATKADDRVLASALMMRGDALLGVGKLDEGTADFRRALELQLALVAAGEDDSPLLEELALSWMNVAYAAEVEKNFEEALQGYRKALEVRETMAAREPNNPARRNLVIDTITNIGSVLEDAGRLRECREHFERALAMARELVATAPPDARWRANLSICMDRMADVLEATGEQEAALALNMEELPLIRELLASDPSNKRYEVGLASTLGRIGALHLRLGDPGRAEPFIAEALAMRRALCAANPTQKYWRRDLGIVLEDAADLALAKGDVEGALATLAEAERIMRELAEANPRNPSWRIGHAVALVRMAGIQDRAGLAEEAAANRKTACGAFEAAGDGLPTWAKAWFAVALFDMERLEEGRQLRDWFRGQGYKLHEVEAAAARAGLAP